MHRTTQQHFQEWFESTWIRAFTNWSASGQMSTREFLDTHPSILVQRLFPKPIEMSQSADVELTHRNIVTSDGGWTHQAIAQASVIGPEWRVRIMAIGDPTAHPVWSFSVEIEGEELLVSEWLFEQKLVN